MPIVYDKERDVWHDQDLSEDEKRSLVRIAIEIILEQSGDILAERFLGIQQKDMFKQSLEKIRIPVGGFKGRA